MAVRRGTPYTRGVGKKRRVRWIVRSFVLLMLALGTVGLMVGRQPELQREVQAVVRDYVFVEVGRDPWPNPEGGPDYYIVYVAKGLNESDIEIIAERFDSACPSCRETAGTREMDWRFAEFEPKALIVSVGHTPENGTAGMFVLFRADDPSSPWDRLRSWWPW